MVGVLIKQRPGGSGPLAASGGEVRGAWSNGALEEIFRDARIPIEGVCARCALQKGAGEGP